MKNPRIAVIILGQEALAEESSATQFKINVTYDAFDGKVMSWEVLII
jgi:hypothetical protein